MTRILLVALALTLAGCDQLGIGITPIKDIVAAPTSYENKEVKLKGKVKGLTKLPLINLKSYTLADDGGEILVLTEAELPAEGASVVVRGKVESGAIIGGQSIGLRVREIQRN